jgi:hypothetical protein
MVPTLNKMYVYVHHAQSNPWKPLLNGRLGVRAYKIQKSLMESLRTHKRSMIIGKYLIDQIFMNSYALAPKCSKIRPFVGFCWALVGAYDQSKYIQCDQKFEKSVKSIKNQLYEQKITITKPAFKGR